MGLVEYSDSESDGDSPSVSAAPSKPAASQSATKQPFRRLVDKANPGKILVSLPSATSSAADEATQEGEDNPAKRRKIGAGGSGGGGGGGGGRFGGFSSFLPPPKAMAIARPSGGGSGSSSGKAAAPKVGVNLKTSSEAAFSRDDNGGDDGALAGEGNNHSAASTGLKLPAPKASAQPSIPEGQKPAEEVKLVGKPLMFKPLSVARKPAKKSGGVKAAPPKAVGTQGTTASSSSTAAAPKAQNEVVQAAAPPKKKKVSLFSVAENTSSTSDAVPGESAPYEPEFTSYDNDSAFADAYPPYDAYQQQQQQQYAGYTQQSQPPTYPGSDPSSLDAIADDLNLSAKARRELFGRGGAAPSGGTANSVINFNLDQEYRHNEELRASGALDQQQHNPLRAIKPGKHSLQQLVNQVQGQRDALEENFAKNRATQKSAGAKYGFR